MGALDVSTLVVGGHSLQFGLRRRLRLVVLCMVNPFGTAAQPVGGGRVVVVAPLPVLATCSDDSKPYMVLKGLDESYKNHVGSAII